MGFEESAFRFGGGFWEPMLTDVELTEKRARTNIAMLQEEGHAEPPTV